MNTKGLLASLSHQLALVGLLYTFYNLISASLIMDFYPLMLFFYVIVITLSVHLFLRKKRTVRSLIVLAFTIGFMAEVAIIIFSNGDLMGKIRAIPFLFFFTAYAIRREIKGTSDKIVLRTFDISVIFLILTSIYTAYYGYLPEISYPSLLSVIISLATLIILRQSSTTRSGHNWLMTALSILLLVFFTILLSDASAILGRGVEVIRGILQDLARGLLAFANWLFSLIPRLFHLTDGGYIYWESDDKYRGGYVENGTLSSRILEIILITIGLVIGLIIRLHFMKYFHVGGKKEKKGNTISEKRTEDLGLMIRRVLAFLLISFKSKNYIRKHRNEADGMYFWLVNALKRDEQGKRKGESPREFLCRLRNMEELNEEGEILFQIAQKSELAFYYHLERSDMTINEARKLRWRIRRIKLSHVLTSALSSISSIIRKSKKPST